VASAFTCTLGMSPLQVLVRLGYRDAYNPGRYNKAASHSRCLNEDAAYPPGSASKLEDRIESCVEKRSKGRTIVKATLLAF
jgi:hypothetical protein